MLFGATSPALVSRSHNGKRAEPRKLSEEQRIVHVLNRLGFGAKPGDVERVRAVGLDAYINQQLNPEKIDDAIADNKVKDLVALKMSTAELYEKYPQPGQLLRQLQARGVLPADAARPMQEMPVSQTNRTCHRRVNRIRWTTKSIARQCAPTIRRTDYNSRNESWVNCKPRESYVQFTATVVSEVMVDFWTNHFNVFAGRALIGGYCPLTTATQFVQMRWRSLEVYYVPRRKVLRCCFISTTSKA